MNFKNTVFVKSAAKKSDFPRDALPRVVFAGRSNVGKSSTINRVVGKRDFARVSSVPGKTVFVPAHPRYYKPGPFTDDPLTSNAQKLNPLILKDQRVLRLWAAVFMQGGSAEACSRRRYGDVSANGLDVL